MQKAVQEMKIPDTAFDGQRHVSVIQVQLQANVTVNTAAVEALKLIDSLEQPMTPLITYEPRPEKLPKDTTALIENMLEEGHTLRHIGYRIVTLHLIGLMQKSGNIRKIAQKVGLTAQGVYQRLETAKKMGMWDGEDVR